MQFPYLTIIIDTRIIQTFAGLSGREGCIEGTSQGDGAAWGVGFNFWQIQLMVDYSRYPRL